MTEANRLPVAASHAFDIAGLPRDRSACRRSRGRAYTRQRRGTPAAQPEPVATTRPLDAMLASAEPLGALLDEACVAVGLASIGAALQGAKAE